MNSHWADRTIDSLCVRVTSGGTPSRANPSFFDPLEGQGMYWLKTKELSDGYVWDTEEKISPDAIQSSSAKVLPAHSVVMAMYGATVGKLGILGREMTCNQAVCAMVVDPEQADYRFLFYRLIHDRHKLINLASGSAQQNLSGSIIKNFKVLVPGVAEQCGIADVLESIDNLQSASRKVATVANELLEALWDSFVLKSSGEAHIADVATVVLGGTPSRANPEFWGGSIPWLNSGRANDFRIVSAGEYITQQGLNSSSTKLMPARSTIIAITGTTLGQISRLEIDACGNQSLVGIYSSNRAVNDWLYFALKSRVDVLTRSATGGAQQHVNKGNIETLLVPVLGAGDLLAWHALSSPLFDLIAYHARLLEQLERTNAELLPKLMTGQMKVNEVETN